MLRPFRAPAAVWRKRVSVVFIFVFLLLFLFVGKLCFCPMYYVELSSLGLAPIFCGPRLYRWLGCGVIAIGLLRASAEQSGKTREMQEIKRIQAEAVHRSHHP